MRRWIDAPLLAITVLGAALRFATLAQQSFWYDESFTVRLARGSFGDLLHGISNTESTPPLYYVVAWLWGHVFGTGEAGLRSLSAVLGTALVVVAFALGRRLGGRTAGLVAAALVAVNPLLLWYSQEARAYMLVTLLCAGTVLAFLDARSSRRALAWWSVLSALALASHYFAIFLVAPEAVLLVRARRRAWPAIGAVAVIALALLPLAFHQRSRSAFLAVGDVDLPHRTAAVPKQFVLGAFADQIDSAPIVAGAVLLLLAAAAVVVLRRRTAGFPAVLGVAVIGVPLVLAVAGADYLNARNVLLALPLLLVAVAIAGGRWALVLAVAFAAVDVAVLSSAQLQRDDWRGIARAIRRDPGVVVLSPPGSSNPLGIYLDGLRPAARPARIVWAVSLTRPPGPVPAGSSSALRAGPERRTASYVLRRYSAAPGASAASVFPGAPAEVVELPRPVP